MPAPAPEPRCRGRTSIRALDELPQPVPALTAAHDFARLYDGGQQLDLDLDRDPVPVLSAAVTKQGAICSACEYDGYDTASEGGDYDDYVLASEGDDLA